MAPEIIERDEFIVIGIRTVLTDGLAAAGNLWRSQFLPRRSEIKNMESRYYGVFNALAGHEKDKHYEYVAGVATDSLEDIPVGMVGWVVPAGKYAELEATGFAGIGAAYKDVFEKWLSESGYALVGTPIFAYTESQSPDAPDTIWKVNIAVETPEELARLANWLK